NPAQNVADLYRISAERFEAMPAFATRRKTLNWYPISFRDLYEQGLDLATGLIDMGVEAREHIALFSDNRFEWILADYGVQLCGAADVPRGREITDEEIIYIINHAEVRVAFVENEKLQNKICRLREKLPQLREIILLDPNGSCQSGVRALLDLVSFGKQLRTDGDKRAEKRIESIKKDDLFTLIYTSGTTGAPKGVMLTHANMISQMEAIPVPISCTDRVLSILPVWHIFERVFEMYTIYSGSCTYYSSVRTLAEDIRHVQPTFMGSAPRLWEGMHKRIMEGIKIAHPVRRALFHIAYFLGNQYNDSMYYLWGNKLKTKKEPLWTRLLLMPTHALRWLIVMPWYGFFNAVVLENVRLSTGGSLKATVSGGGALPPEIDRFFNTIGIPVLEGYGLTETSPVVAVRTEKQLIIGTIGPTVPNTEVRIVDMNTNEVLYPNSKYPDKGRGFKGELFVRGPQVMKGYYRQPELTEKVLQDGWLRTGDLAMMTFNNCLKILGRSKSTIVLSNGENLEPEPLELRLSQSHLIDHCMIIGQDKKFIGALIVPNIDGLREKGVKSDSLSELVKNKEAHRLINDDIREKISTNNGFRNYEHIRDFRLLANQFEIGVELTDLHKMKRHVITDKYQDVIHEIYSDETVNAK
ncbi:MAG: long-chain fatty acid--CoA ligase, partial [Balneolales bacterium]